MLILGGLSLNAIAVFMAAVFGMNVMGVMFLMGFLVTLLAMLGGSFGVAASDFVQMFLVVLVTVAVSVLALGLPEIGGIGGMLEKAPAAHYSWSKLARPEFILLFFVALNITKLFEENAIDKSAKFLMAQDDRNARLTLVIPIAGAVLGPLLWLIPPTVAAIRHPDMAALFPNLKVPNEAAFLLTASEVLPQGMMGLLVCGIFAATLTTMDAGLNQGAGIFVRNFYLPILNPQCPEKKLLLVSKLATGACGAIMLGFGLMWENMRESNLFDLLNQVAISLGLPISIPLFLGLYFRKTPRWAAWSTVLVGLVVSLSFNAAIKRAESTTIGYAEARGDSIVITTTGEHPFKAGEILTFKDFDLPAEAGNPKAKVLEVLSPRSFRIPSNAPAGPIPVAPGAIAQGPSKVSAAAFAWVPGLGGNLTKEELTQFALFATVFIVAAVCVGWFFLTSLFHKSSSAAYRADVDEFFHRLQTPIEKADESANQENKAMAVSIGKLLMIYGGFVASLVWIPQDSMTERLIFPAIGSIMLTVGAILWHLHRNAHPIPASPP
jgi:Na+/proline symporter